MLFNLNADICLIRYTPQAITFKMTFLIKGATGQKLMNGCYTAFMKI